MKKLPINIVREQFTKSKFDKVVNTNFTQLVAPTVEEVREPTVEDFFNLYEKLFYEIPITGENSHTTLIEKSSEYIDYNNQSESIKLLLEEINDLQDQINTLTLENIKLLTPST
jgi:HSP90 family molecular chaperone